MSKRGLPSIYYCDAGIGLGITKAEVYVKYIFKVVASSPSTLLTQTATVTLSLRVPSEFEDEISAGSYCDKNAARIRDGPMRYKKADEGFLSAVKVLQYSFTLTIDYRTVV